MGVVKELALGANEECETVLAEDFDVFESAIHESLEAIEQRLQAAAQCGYGASGGVLLNGAMMPSMEDLIRRLEGAVSDLRGAYESRRDFDAEIDAELYDRAMARDD